MNTSVSRLASAPQTQNSPLQLRPNASSTHKTAIRVYRVHDKTSPRSDRSVPARKPSHAISPILPLPPVSSIQGDSSSAIWQDAVYIALTVQTSDHRSIGVFIYVGPIR